MKIRWNIVMSSNYTFVKKLFLFDASIIRFLNKKITERTRYDETRGPTERKVNAQAVRNGV